MILVDSDVLLIDLSYRRDQLLRRQPSLPGSARDIQYRVFQRKRFLSGRGRLRVLRAPARIAKAQWPTGVRTAVPHRGFRESYTCGLVHRRPVITLTMRIGSCSLCFQPTTVSRTVPRSVAAARQRLMPEFRKRWTPPQACVRWAVSSRVHRYRDWSSRCMRMSLLTACRMER